MQEIKVRAWDEEAEHMFYSDKQEDDYFFEFHNGKLRGYAIRPPKPSSDPMEPPEPYCDDYPIEQCTGLKDWYAGDIIQKGEIIRAITVDWEHGLRFMLGKHILCKQDAINGTRIGNVHQKPELMEIEE